MSRKNKDSILEYFAKDTIARDSAGLDVILHILQQVKVNDAERINDGHMLIALPICQWILCIFRPHQYQGNLILGLSKHLELTRTPYKECFFFYYVFSSPNSI